MLDRSNGSQTGERISSKLRRAFLILLEAFDYAKDTGSDPWEFAVEMRCFKEFGLGESDLRWLERKGYVEHRREVTRLEDDVREFRPTGNLSFDKRTCFVLTVMGAECGRSLDAHKNGTTSKAPLESDDRIEVDAAHPADVHHATPVWDAQRRELRVNGYIVKQFKWSAANQEMILAAFEEEHWPVRIDDPLPPHEAQDSKRRLSDTIKCLNRKQKHSLIHFRGDGTGEGVIWERVEPKRTEAANAAGST